MSKNGLTIEEMRRLIERLEQAKEKDVEIPQQIRDKIQAAVNLNERLKSLPVVDWDKISTADEIEQAEGAIHLKTEVLEEASRLFGIEISTGRGKRGRKAAGERQRQPRRNREQIEFDMKVAEITREQKEKLGLPSRGRLTEDDKIRLQEAIEKEMKKQKLQAPKA